MQNHGRTKVLFVNSDLGALHRLEHELRGESTNWDMRFVDSGRAALSELDQQGTADVVVADLDMSIAESTTLMEAIRRHHPKAIRIATSKRTDLTLAKRAMPLAHQFISFPVKPIELVVAVERTMQLQQSIASTTTLSALGSLDILPSPPNNVLELNLLLSRQDTSIEEVASIIAGDAAMTAKLLQLVNSAFFGLGHRVTTVRHAVGLLGLTTVRNLLTAVELVRSFASTAPDLIKAIEQIHNHSLAVAEQARTIMKQHPLIHDAFAAGMMHDVGLLAIIATQPERYRELRSAIENGKDLDDCELEIVGASHSHIGAYLLGLWGLPYALVEAVALSHTADLMTDAEMSPVHAVFLAEQIVNMRSDEHSSWETPRLPSLDYMQALGVEHLFAQSVGRSSGFTLA